MKYTKHGHQYEGCYLIISTLNMASNKTINATQVEHTEY